MKSTYCGILNIDTHDKVRAPPPTESELKLRNILRYKKIPFKHSQIIWYTGCDKYTPDLIIGEKLIIEVDGKIHDKEFMKTPDRIRQRALKNMGFEVHRVRNEHIQSLPSAVAADIIQKYYEVVDTPNKTTKVSSLKATIHHESVPRDIAEKLQFWAMEFNKELNDEKWTANHFKESLNRFHPELVTNQCAMERLILLLLGLNLHKTQDSSSLNFEYFSNLLKKGIEIIRGIFGGVEGDAVAIHLKNMYNISAPGFFKNLIFKGGPNLNPGVITIKDKSTLDSIVDKFNKSFSDIGITVERSEIKSECNAVLMKFDKTEESSYSWLVDWMNNIP
jgi:very-short-patch-repair endonuclease